MIAIPDYYGTDGKTLRFEEWAALLSNEQYRHVASDRLEAITLESGEKTTIVVQTRWLGLNMGNCDGPIQIFETGISLEPAAPLPQLLRQRYSTKEASRRGHATGIWNIFQGKHPFAPPHPNPLCVTCRTLPVLERLGQGYWTCQACHGEIRAGRLVYPVALATW